LLMLFEAGRLTIAFSVFGANMLYTSSILRISTNELNNYLRSYLCLIVRPKDTSLFPVQ
jgi:hypothetical protein